MTPVHIAHSWKQILSSDNELLKLFVKQNNLKGVPKKYIFEQQFERFLVDKNALNCF